MHARSCGQTAARSTVDNDETRPAPPALAPPAWLAFGYGTRWENRRAKQAYLSHFQARAEIEAYEREVAARRRLIEHRARQLRVQREAIKAHREAARRGPTRMDDRRWAAQVGVTLKLNRPARHPVPVARTRAIQAGRTPRVVRRARPTTSRRSGDPPQPAEPADLAGRELRAGAAA
jgi:hypothetical protein